MRRCKGEKLLRDFNGKKLITFFLLMLLNLKEQRDGKRMILRGTVNYLKMVAPWSYIVT